MVDTGTITRAGVPVFNSTTGVYTPGTPTTVHTGPCRLRQPTTTETEVLFGEEQVTELRFIACFPWNVFGVRIGDVIALSSSADTDANNRTYRVVSIPSATFVLYKGFGVVVVE